MRLIASDLDGTLLTSAKRPSPRTLAALAAARDAGVVVVPASGRQPFSIAEALAGTFLAEGIVLGSNGAIAVDLRTGAVLFERTVAPAAQAELFAHLVARFPGVRCVSVRDGGTTFVPQHGYTGMMDPGDHGRSGSLPEFDLDTVVAAPSLKFIVRDPGVPVAELLAAATAAQVPGVSVTTSGAPFLEVAAEGVDKGTGLARLCGVLGIAAEDVVAFGDERNDLGMLTWAGRGVAMGNAIDDVVRAADEVTTTNDEEGVARVVERLLRGAAGPQRGAVPAR